MDLIYSIGLYGGISAVLLIFFGLKNLHAKTFAQGLSIAFSTFLIVSLLVPIISDVVSTKVSGTVEGVSPGTVSVKINDDNGTYSGKIVNAINKKFTHLKEGDPVNNIDRPGFLPSLPFLIENRSIPTRIEIVSHDVNIFTKAYRYAFEEPTSVAAGEW